MTDRITKIAVALLFAVAFAVSGAVLPSMYASHAPDSRFLEVHDFQAQDTHPQAGAHYVCFDRDVKRGTTGTVDLNLYKVSGPTGFTGYVDGGASSGEASTRYFQEGHHKIIRPIPLPEQMEEGQYRYLLVVKLELANGEVTRQFTYRSNTFTVSEKNANETSRRDFDCGGLGVPTKTIGTPSSGDSTETPSETPAESGYSPTPTAEGPHTEPASPTPPDD